MTVHAQIPPKPTVPPFKGLPDYPAIQAMRARRQWVAWDYFWKPKKWAWDKPPINPHTGEFGSHSDSSTWGSYEEAAARVQASHLAGVGFALSPDDGLTGIDLDHCRNRETGELAPWAAELVTLGETYCEVSPSGEGLRLILAGKVDKAVKHDPAGVEIYVAQRYLTITGQRVTGTPVEIRPAPKTLAALMRRVDDFDKQKANTFAGHAARQRGINSDPFWRAVNSAALGRPDAWVPALFPSAKYQPGTRGYRVTSRDLGRDFEEDLSITPEGIKDFGVHDMGDPREGRRTPVDLVLHYGDKSDVAEAALWLCGQLGIEPASLGWRNGDARQGGRALENAAAKDVITEAEEIDGGAITQDGVARVFARRFEHLLKFCHSDKSWYVWDGTHWRRDETHLALHWVRNLGREFSEGSKDPILKEVRRITFVAGVERFAQVDPAFAVTIDHWDQDPYLLGTPGGTVNLRTGELRSADPQDAITKLTAVTPAETDDCPLWRKFIDETFASETAVIRFMQQYLGYSLTGDITEHALVFGSGDGGNGKGVLLNTASRIMGDYAVTAAMDTFVASKHDRHPTDLAMLRGARLVTASETERGRAWAESRIKALTGGDPISARFMHKDFFTYRPQFKLFVIGNHRPSLSGVDDAMRRRFNIVPFNNKPAVRDPELEEKLHAEWPGILRWMINGCLDWQTNRLVRPTSVIEATEAYFADQDLLAQWLDECCDVKHDDSNLMATSQELFTSWTTFARANSREAGTMTAFGEALGKKGFVHKKKVPRGFGISGHARGFAGLALRPEPTRQASHG